jgi:hypothetical protein
MALNKGTLITAAIRPNDDADLIASAFANEIMGGHHQYAKYASMSAIMEARREWGMLCTVYDDGENNGTYQLVYGASSPTITDDNNWVPFSGGGSGTTGEWLSSVLSVIDTPPGTTPSNGSRYLIGTPSFGDFVTQSNKIGIWSDSANGGFGDWSYITPQSGYTLRVDDQKNVIYKYDGTWSLNNNWKKEYLTQVRYIQPSSTEGTTYSFTSSIDLTPLDAYSYSVYYANFNATNSGPSKLQIDGLGYYDMKKLSSSGLVDLSSQDILPNVQYHLSWNTNNFMVHGLGGGAIGASSGVIGPAEDGTYTDGLYTDLTASTPIGIPIDRFNEILKALVPSPAPDLSSWSMSGPQFVTDGKLSFDNLTPTFFGAPGFGIGDAYTTTTYRKGIISGVTQPNVTSDIYYQDLTGQLNSQVPATTAYDQYAFGNGTTGSLILKLNSITVSNVDLGSTISAIDTTKVGVVTGATSGLNLTAATNSKFQSGVPFDLFWWRKGNYLIKKNNPNLRKGHNFLELSHVLPSTTLILASYSWVTDFSSSVTNFTENITGISVDATNGVKVLSGIKYYNSVSLNYQVSYVNHVNSTYKSGNALFATSVTASTSVNNNITNTITNLVNSVIMVSSASPTIIDTPGSPTSPLTKLWNYQLNTNVRRLNESITFRTSVQRTVQGTDQSNGVVIAGWFIDNVVGESPSNTIETFEVETFRISNGSDKYSTGVTDTVAQITTTYNSSTSLLSAGYTNQLQYCNGLLIYPKFNFQNVSTIDKNPNFGNPLANYNDATTSGAGHGTYSSSPATNNRTFTRRFRMNSNDTFAKLEFIFIGTNFNFVSATTTLDDNNLWCEVKLPTDPSRGIPSGGLIDGGVTGWMDMTKEFDPAPPTGSPWRNGAGVRTGVPSSNKINIDFGNRNTYLSNGYVLLRITAPPSWSGNMDSIFLFPGR